MTISLRLVKHSPKGACLLPSPNSILFALAIFKCYLLQETEAHYQSEPRRCATHSCPEWINAEAGRTVFALLSAAWGCLMWWWLGQSGLLPSKLAKGTEQLEAGGFSSLPLTSSGVELVRRR